MIVAPVVPTVPEESVAEADQGATLFEILNDPLSVVFAELAKGFLVGEFLCHGFAGSDVLEDGGAGVERSGSDGDFDYVPGGDSDVKVVSVLAFVSERYFRGCLKLRSD